MVTTPMSDAQTFVKYYNDWQFGKISHEEFIKFIKVIPPHEQQSEDDFHESGWERYRFSDGSWSVIELSNNGLGQQRMYVPVDGLIF